MGSHTDTCILLLRYNIDIYSLFISLFFNRDIFTFIDFIQTTLENRKTFIKIVEWWKLFWVLRETITFSCGAWEVGAQIEHTCRIISSSSFFTFFFFKWTIKNKTKQNSLLDLLQFCFCFVLVVWLHGRWGLRSLIRDQACTACIEGEVLTPRPLGKSPSSSF